MFSQSCHCLPNKRQSIITGQSTQNMGLLGSISSKPYLKFEDSADHISLDFQATSKSTSNNHFTSGTSIMDLVYSFTETSRVKFNRRYMSTLPLPAERSKLNCKDLLTQCNTMPTSPLVRSYLVGGFVGSKSQLGRRRKNDLGKMNLWDIIRDVINLVGNAGVDFPEKQNHPSSSSLGNKYEVVQDSNAQKDYDLRLMQNNNSDSLNDCKVSLNSKKQSYADVAKRPTRDHQSIKMTAPSVDQESVPSSESCGSPLSVIESISLCNRTNSLNRDRIASECSADSEDSFIIFEYCEDDNVDKDVYSSDDETLSFIDEVSQSDSGIVPSSNSSCSSKPSSKKVRFAEGKNLIKVHPMVTWNFAYRMARRGPWEMLARDTERFKIRIAKTEAVLKPILDPQHRSVVFRDRFSDSV